MAGAAYAAIGSYVWHQPAAVLATGTAVAMGAGVLPDLDSVGSCVARSFGWITEGLAYAVRAVSGGHREGTHTGCGDVLCALLATLAIALEGHHFWVHVWHVRRELSVGRVILAAYLAILFSAAMMALRHPRKAHRRELLALAAAVAMAWTGWDSGGIAWAIFIGTAVHCAGDGLTKHGVPWLKPLSNHVLHLLPERFRISTGHFTERWLIAPAMMLALGLLAWHAAAVSLPSVRL